MTYPGVTQFETIDRRARVVVVGGAHGPTGRAARSRKRLRLRRRLTPQPC